MLEKALKGSSWYWIWILVLLGVIGAGAIFYMQQLFTGLTVTGLSRDVTWGLYIAQLTFLVGVAASAVMVVLPYYLHDYKEFGKLTILGEFLAIPAVIMCMAFVFVDMGQPMRILNVFLHPTPNSVMFWDTVVLFGYLILNIVISRVTFEAEYKGIAPPKWIKPVIILSIPWAISIHTVTAFLYAGLPGRGYWLTAIMAPRFLASAFAAGPAILILLVLLLRRLTGFDPGRKPILKLSEIVTYAMLANVFFILMEVFTAFYSAIPEHTAHFEFLFVGLEGMDYLVPWMWSSMALAAVALVILLVPRLRKDTKVLPWACGAVIVSIWIDKGLGLMTGGFVPTPTHEVVRYVPTLPEVMITLMIYAVGALILTILFKIAVTTRASVEQWDATSPTEAAK
jgi:molybdopterin-containing oxidoreductase family membrane subunit